MKNKINKFLSRNVRSNSVIADFCCGTGITIEFLVDKGRMIYGIDTSRDMINICKRRFKGRKNVNLVNGDVLNTGLNKDYFDYVVIRMGLHHIKDKEAVINEAHRILKKKGKFIIIDKFQLHNTFITLVYDFLRNLVKGYPVLGHHYITIQNFIQIAEKKFKIVSCFKQEKEIYLKANVILEKL